jgi:hypothetical protein
MIPVGRKKILDGYVVYQILRQEENSGRICGVPDFAMLISSNLPMDQNSEVDCHLNPLLHESALGIVRA